MRVFITGATGFIGTELVKELIEAGHDVRGLTRSDAGVEQLKAMGAEVHRGNLTDLDSLRRGATGMDVVVNLAFSHDDMSQFARNAKDEIQAIEALGSVMKPGNLLVVTSGIGIANGAPGQVRKENEPPADSPAMPRRPEQAAQAVAAKGVHVGIVRLPQVHDTRKQGLVTWLIQIAREKGLSAYVGDGANRWAAAPLKDVAHLYRLAVEKTGPGVTTYHAVQEEGVSLRDIAEMIGKGLKVPVVSIPAEKAGEHFGIFFGHAVTQDMPAASEWTRKTLGWDPAGPGLIEDLANMRFADTRTLIKQAYSAFNKRDIDAALALMTQDVNWPKASEGGRVVGREAIRAYWTRQWGEFDPHVEPLAMTEEDGGKTRVRVHQLVKSLQGDVLSDSEVLHVFTVKSGLIAAMELGNEADTTAGPSAAFAHRS